MRAKSLALTLAAFLLLGAFSAVPAAAEPRGTGLNRLWAQLLELFTSGWSDAGCIADPNGDCTATSGPADDHDAGCILDPDGRCHEHADLGCALEPYGGCKAGSRGPDQADAGCIADPDGRCHG